MFEIKELCNNLNSDINILDLCKKNRVLFTRETEAS